MIKLYILVRTDMASMNAGRTAAQVAHAANYFVTSAKEIIEMIADEDDPFVKNFNEWENQTDQGYGTTIVLDAGDIASLENIMTDIEYTHFTAMVIDPEYPIKDGNVIHIIKNVKTCAFAFAFNQDDASMLKDLKLYGSN